ncbi:MAG TPA: M56 family metallopeptidase [Clostridia bacterium]|nr:M56 family metallopeptidase [Clostridia bacterium]
MDYTLLKLLNMSITASYLIIAIIIVRVLFKKAPRWIFGILWGMVGFRLLIPASIKSILSLVPQKEAISMEGIMGTNAASGEIISDAYKLTENIAATNITANESLADILLHMGSYVWITGVAALIAYGLFSYFKMKKLTDSSTLIDSNIYSSSRISTPFILGVIKPRIYIPTDLGKDEYDPVITHEKAHIRRKDHWIKPFGFLLLSIYWFNPLVWIAYILLCRDIELACDEAVIKRMGDNERKTYSKALLSCSVHRRIIAACPLAFGEVSVKGRIRNVLDYKKPSLWIIICSLAACAVISVVLLTNPIEQTDAEIPVGTYEFKECLYNNPLSSFFPFDGTDEIYIIDDSGLVIVNKSNEEIKNEYVIKSHEATDFNKKEFEDLFVFNPDVSKISLGDYKTSVYWELSDGYRIYKMDDEIWLASIMGKNGFWSIYNLSIITSESVDTPVDIADTSVKEEVIPEQMAMDDLQNIVDSINKTVNYYETESVGILSELLSVDNTVMYSENDFSWPVPKNREDPNLEDSYGMKFNSILHEWYLQPGIIIEAQEGTDVIAVNSGTVMNAEYMPGFGIVIVINHGGGYASLYAHCSKILVEEGQIVESGEVVGLVGSTGLATEPCLFFGMIFNGAFFDPFDVIDRYS